MADFMVLLFCLQARNAVARGDYNVAHTYANEARSYALLSIGIGSGLFVPLFGRPHPSDSITRVNYQL